MNSQIYKSANAQIFSHYESANKLPRKRNIDRYREPQQRFTKPQTGLYMICRQALYMYSISQHQQSGGVYVGLHLLLPASYKNEYRN